MRQDQAMYGLGSGVISSNPLAARIGAIGALPDNRPCLLISVDSFWGGASEHWAGYSATLCLCMPAVQKGNITLRFTSKDLGQLVAPSAFRGALVSYDPASFEYSLSYFDSCEVRRGHVVSSVIVEARGAFEVWSAIDACTVNGESCDVRVVDKTLLRDVVFSQGGL